MPRGGRRLNAGRKPGAGIPVKTTLRGEARAALAEIVGTSRDPLFVAIDIASDPEQPTNVRLEAALGCCRYLHPTLSAAAVQHVPAARDSAGAMGRLKAALDRLAPSSPPVLAGPAEPLEHVAEPAPVTT